MDVKKKRCDVADLLFTVYNWFVITGQCVNVEHRQTCFCHTFLLVHVVTLFVFPPDCCKCTLAMYCT